MLDGGLGTTLEASGHDLTGDLWSARVLAASLRETLVASSRTPGVVAVGVNCCPPEAVSPAIADAAAVPYVVYPNSGETWDAAARVWTGDPGRLLASLDVWLVSGARIIGGCCRTTPDDIAAIARRLR